MFHSNTRTGAFTHVQGVTYIVTIDFGAFTKDTESYITDSGVY